MNTVILVILQYLGDADKIQLLSTCRAFRTLLNQVRFTGRYDYYRIKHVSYLDSFTHIHGHIAGNAYIDPHICEVTYCFSTESVVHIPAHVKIVNIQYTDKNLCTIPETVEKITLTNVDTPIRIQDGDCVIIKQFNEDCVVARKSSHPLVVCVNIGWIFHAHCLNVGRIVMGYPALTYQN